MASNKVKAYILLNVVLGKENDVINEMKKIPNVTDANVVYGEYDAIIEIEANSLDELNKTIAQIRRNNSILRTVTLIVV
ncbi:MAG: Lrp/AsnC ligand binding domain-containing protein [Sulfolobaceae archaeon]|nr:Lrp/AsnC ligand binding domain-containing protein [Sulfolobaceae archaeon]